ncbi:xylan 1,4-beta-xylosidase [Agromyces protaetiae]|uniref:Xylan 1,4-beta-xylosidase n=1 Tax=Agromyces protaetiae TaxID=2509455 RepID=A0A4P6FBE7_9MICO|nr:xylan 1,4-beta-xylosidase [Agromyces protaetiae]QAY72303.1 xylan 1,4-beta-xylosidase [Agromyces protaetiae]
MTATVAVPAEPIGTLSDAWRECVGTGRLNLALRHDYVESLKRVQREIGFKHLRGHGLLSDDVGIHRPYEHGGERRVRHAFTYADQIFDSWLELGIRPFVELGFMPSGLASGDQTVFWWKGNVTPPADEREWVDLVTGVVRHLIDRYGIDEVRTWPIEVWNEPNLTHFWQGADQAAYHRLYEITSSAIKDVDASLQVGGPAISPGSDEWWGPFADFVERSGSPVDFVSRHAYTSGPSQHVPFGVYQTLARPETLLEQFDAPRRHLEGTALAGLPTHITEFNTSYRPDSPVHDTAYNATYLAPVLASGGDFADSFSYWTFCDVFEEENIPTSIFHGGFGLLGHRQLAKPTYHLYTFMARLGAEILARGADHLVTRHADGRLAILAWQPVDGTDAGAASHSLRLALPVAGPAASVHRLRVSETDGNAWNAWRDLGRPHHPTSRQLDLLHEASRPTVEQRAARAAGGILNLDLTLSQHEVTIVEIDPVRDETEAWIDDARIPGYAQTAGVR